MDDTRLALSDVRGPLKDLIGKLAGDNGPEHLARLNKMLRGEALPAWRRILEFIKTVVVSATPRFVASDHFKVDVSPEAKVKIAFIGDNFKDNFLGTTEEDVLPTKLRIHRLTESSLDAPIIAALGGRHETKLAHLHQLLLRQPKGEEGDLLTNGYANIFYIRDATNKLWAVDVGWSDAGWRVSAFSVEDPHGWLDGRQVFSRDS